MPLIRKSRCRCCLVVSRPRLLAILELTPSNFLIMDEPTNHLDDETKEGLKSPAEYPGT